MSYWAVFAWSVLPAGAILTMMQLSGNRLAMWLAGALLGAPINLGSLRLSIAVFMTALCGSMSIVTFSALRRMEDKVAASEGSALIELSGEVYYKQQMNLFIWGRNFYLSLLGLSLWLIAWRLKACHDGGQLLSSSAVYKGSRATRALYVILGLIAFLAADVPLCRVNYNAQLLMSVTPKKNRLLNNLAVSGCENVWLQDSHGTKCQEFCAEVQALSEERFAIIQFARNWHILGRLAAEIFDDARGVVQGANRIEGLFDKKTCAQVLRSVDKSNQSVNAMCIVTAAIAIVGAFAALSNAFYSDGPKPSPSEAPPVEAAQGVPPVNSRPHAD